MPAGQRVRDGRQPRWRRWTAGTSVDPLRRPHRARLRDHLADRRLEVALSHATQASAGSLRSSASSMRARTRASSFDGLIPWRRGVDSTSRAHEAHACGWRTLKCRPGAGAASRPQSCRAAPLRAHAGAQCVDALPAGRPPALLVAAPGPRLAGVLPRQGAGRALVGEPVTVLVGPLPAPLAAVQPRPPGTHGDDELRGAPGTRPVRRTTRNDDRHAFGVHRPCHRVSAPPSAEAARRVENRCAAPAGATRAASVLKRARPGRDGWSPDADPSARSSSACPGSSRPAIAGPDPSPPHPSRIVSGGTPSPVPSLTIREGRRGDQPDPFVTDDSRRAPGRPARPFRH